MKRIEDLIKDVAQKLDANPCINIQTGARLIRNKDGFITSYELLNKVSMLDSMSDAEFALMKKWEAFNHQNVKAYITMYNECLTLYRAELGNKGAWLDYLQTAGFPVYNVESLEHHRNKCKGIPDKTLQK